MDGLGDTLDLVPIGAWHGNGRKAGWWSPVLLAVWDITKERLVAVCKCMSGKSHCAIGLRVRGSNQLVRVFGRILQGMTNSLCGLSGGIGDAHSKHRISLCGTPKAPKIAHRDPWETVISEVRAILARSWSF